MDTATKEQLLDRFRAYLDSTADTDTSAMPATDLFDLFTELAALKNEVRLESRQVKTALDDFRSVFDTLQTSHATLQAELERQQAGQTTQRRAALRSLLLELLELRDRLEAGLAALQRFRPSRLGWLCRRESALIQAMTQGQTLSLQRLEQLLNAHQVTALQARGRPLDPHTMRAAEIEYRAELDNGIVTEELRKGFVWEDELLRLAEVKVNKHPE